MLRSFFCYHYTRYGKVEETEISILERLDLESKGLDLHAACKQHATTFSSCVVGLDVSKTNTMRGILFGSLVLRSFFCYPSTLHALARKSSGKPKIYCLWVPRLSVKRKTAIPVLKALLGIHQSFRSVAVV